MQKMKLSEILRDQTITTQFDFTGTCPDQEGEPVSFTIFNTSYFLNEVLYKYFDRELFVLDDSTAFNELVTRFNTWKSSRGSMFARMAYAYSLGYNPIENYSSIEKHTGHDDYENKKKVTHAYDVETPLKITRLYDADNPLKVTTGHENDKQTETYNQLKDEAKNERYGVNSATKQPVSEDSNTRTGNVETTYSGSRHDTTTGTYSDTTTGKFTDENSGTDSQIYNSQIEKRGNIGIQTASEMTQKLYDGLIQDIAGRALREFINDNTFYAEGVFLW